MNKIEIGISKVCCWAGEKNAYVNGDLAGSFCLATGISLGVSIDIK